MRVIVCLFVECSSEGARADLEVVLYTNKYAFYDATAHTQDVIRVNNSDLLQIETDIEDK